MNRNDGGGGDRKKPRPPLPSAHDDEPTQIMSRPAYEQQARGGPPARAPAP